MELDSYLCASCDVVLLGDFNCVLRPEDSHVGCYRYDESAGALESLLQRFNFYDVADFAAEPQIP